MVSSADASRFGGGGDDAASPATTGVPVPPGPTAVYAREQIAIPPYTLGVLKEFQKATIRHFRGRRTVAAPQLIDFAAMYFGHKHRAAQARLEREEAYRAEWSGRKGEVRELFQQFDVNGDGSIEPSEVEHALAEVQNFFGYSLEQAGYSEWVPREEVDGKALFAQLDSDQDGRILWDEFWGCVSAWMESNFDQAEHLRAREEQKRILQERLEQEERARAQAEAEAAAAAEAERAAAEQRRRAEEAERERARKAAADRAAALRRKEEEAAERARQAEAQRRKHSNARAAQLQRESHEKELANERERREQEDADNAARAASADKLAAAPRGGDLAGSDGGSGGDSGVGATEGESDLEERRAQALARLDMTAATAYSVDELLPAIVACIEDGKTSGASPLDCVALRRAPAVRSLPGAPDAPLFVAITPATAARAPWAVTAEDGGTAEPTADAASASAATAGGASSGTPAPAEEGPPLVTVVWASAGHPLVAPGQALQRITELPVEMASFAALDGSLAASDATIAAAHHGNGGDGDSESEGLFVARPLRLAPAVAQRGATLGVVGSGVPDSAGLAHSGASCQFVALRRARADGSVELDIAMATPQHPFGGVRVGEVWAPGRATGDALSGLAGACLDMVRNPPAELLEAAARGDSRAHRSYAPSTAELGGSNGTAAFLAASREVRLHFILDPKFVDAHAGDGDAPPPTTPADAILGIVGVGPEAASFSPAPSRPHTEGGGRGAATEADGDLALQVVAAPRGSDVALTAGGQLKAQYAAGNIAGYGGAGTVLRNRVIAAEEAATGGAGALPLELLAHEAYATGGTAADEATGIVAVALEDAEGRRLGVVTAQASAGEQGGTDALLAFVQQVSERATAAITTVRIREAAARASERATRAATAAEADALLAGARLDPARATTETSAILPAAVQGGIADVAWAVLDRATGLGHSGVPPPAFVALLEPGLGAGAFHVVGATPLHPVVRTGDVLRPASDRMADSGEDAEGGFGEARRCLAALANASSKLVTAAEMQRGHELKAQRGAGTSLVPAHRDPDPAPAEMLAALTDAARDLVHSEALAPEAVTVSAAPSPEGEGEGLPAQRVLLSPLMDASGRAIGVLGTGDPAAATQMQTGLAAFGGLALSAAIRKHKMSLLLSTGEAMLSNIVHGKSIEVVEVPEGTVPSDPSREVVIVIRGDDGRAVRTLLVRAGAALNDFELHMLAEMGDVLSAAYAQVEGAPVVGGDGLTRLTSDAATAQVLPDTLMRKVRDKLSELTMSSVSELKSYRKPPPAVLEVMRGCFVLLGRDEASVKTWPQVKAGIVTSGNNDLLDEMRRLDVREVSREVRARWRLGEQATQRLDVDLAWKKGSKASAYIYEWLQHCFVAHQLFVKLRKDELAQSQTPAAKAELDELLGDEQQEAENQAALVVQRHARGRLARLKK